MKRTVGTVVRGLRAPVIHEGDDLVKIVVETLLESSKEAQYMIEDRDVLAITESILARAQGNYVTLDQIAKDIQNKLQSKKIGVVFPITSRNRFQSTLKAIARAADEVIVQLSYPSDEVGNPLMLIEDLDDAGINPWTDVFTEAEIKKIFADMKHPFTGVDYLSLYRETIEGEGANCTIILANQPKAILDYTDTVIAADLHTRKRTQKRLLQAGASKVLRLDEIMNQPIDGSGSNPDFGLLGANLSSDEIVKLFPINGEVFVNNVQSLIKDLTGKTIDVMIYGDGAFKDPQSQIWELADPIVSPAYTSGLEGTPDEVKLKYLADGKFKDLEGQDLQTAISDYIAGHAAASQDQAERIGTTPRQLTDLLGSLSDLTSGSGDKGTPFIYIKGYFDKYSDQ
ncbi:coenzyme F420-0:L-glutamate ligase [Facklamia sp. 7083-14-GEN3]|uniref:coenzyme F420-0:L-glutamate ligase n=1 Tax=Facklamia sp. 7083-14-GEN3 TaxID=2973478 RepID=UPI00215B98A9|nr:coenzyme F420-0:L-glutamate ligase [Facklamia sp. 7083-14-GEN3]MCR8968882.1 coenzyme F420-0:L-glutamate ligase [Facklamia sp. 7083-14-GEN3]